MSKTSSELRYLATNCLARARQAGPNRARQLRQAAAALRRQAIQADLLEHATIVGRVNVTLGTFRDHLRATQGVHH